METKIPFYNLLNMFLTGLIFTGCCIVLFYEKIVLLTDSAFFDSIKSMNVGLETIITICFCAIIYEIGYIINRIGSFMEDFLKLIKLIPFDNDYKNFNDKSAKLPVLSTLSREYALSRTSMTLFLMMTIISSVHCHRIFAVVMLALTILFYFSMKKHALKIVTLMKD